MTGEPPIVAVRDLRVELAGAVEVVDCVSFSIERGELLGLVGESGSGKTTVATTLLGHTRRGARVTGGSVTVGGRELLGLPSHSIRDLRGAVVGYVPQDPSAALNPALRIGYQIRELLAVHRERAAQVAGDGADRIRHVLREVKLPDDDEFLRRYPHQLSGGQQQRVAIAMAFLLRPQVIVLDEPTTGLDVTTQAHVLTTVRDLSATYGVAALYVTHDLAVVASIAHRIVVMYAGRTVEIGDRQAVFERSAHPYTRKLLAAAPQLDERRHLAAIPGQAPAPGERAAGCPFAPRCELAIDACRERMPELITVSVGHQSRCLRVEEVLVRGHVAPALREEAKVDDGAAILTLSHVDAFHGELQVLYDVSLDVRARECLAVVGESGSGKTTLSRVIVGLHRQWSGDLRIDGQPLADRPRARPLEIRRRVQYVFQSPHNSFNPRRTIGDAVMAPVEHFFGLRGKAARDRVLAGLARVSLSARAADAYPAELSGGERQRAAIARALVSEPEILICDEVTSALDVSVQAAIVELLADLQRHEELALVFITHNLLLVRSLADRVVVLESGRIVEQGRATELFEDPDDPYTRELLRDTPSFTIGAVGEVRGGGASHISR